MTVAAVFLDRDGVINADSGYVGDWDSFVFLPGVIEAMRKLCESGYALVVVTNQSGIARGFYTEEDFHVLTDRMCKERCDPERRPQVVACAIVTRASHLSVRS